MARDHAVVSRREPTARMEGLPVAISMGKEASHMARSSSIIISGGGGRSTKRTKNGGTRVGFRIKKGVCDGSETAQRVKSEWKEDNSGTVAFINFELTGRKATMGACVTTGEFKAFGIKV